MMKRLFPLLLLLASPILAQDKTVHKFTKYQLSPYFWSEGAHVGDFNKDGKMDVVSGPYWYEGPEFKTAHEYYPATKTFERAKPDGTKEQVPGFEGGLGEKNAYSDNFLTYTHDFNGDGWTDVLVYGFPGKETIWYENPQGKPGHWPKHVVFDVTDNESPTFGDITGDGKPEIICSSTQMGKDKPAGFLGYATANWEKPTEPWTFHRIAPPGPWQRFTHGLGFGDVNGDGRADLLEAGGWWEQPASLDGDPVWQLHKEKFGNGGAQMYAYDVNGDGLNDVITSIAAHGYGLAWFEQKKEGEFIPHVFVNQKPEENRYGIAFSQPHAMDLVDMDGDGLKDIVTGKRFWAHGKTGDPEPNAPAVLYWFKLVRNADKSVDFVPYLIDDDSGVGTQVLAQDVNGDGLVDVVVGNKKGTFVHLHATAKVSKEEYDKAQPPVKFPDAKVGLAPESAPKLNTTLVRDTEALTPEQERAKLKVPDGFEIQLFASEPMINKPINLAIDAKNRVWVSSTVEYPYSAAKERWADAQGSRVKDSRDAIKILEDTNGDGQADKVTDFADGLNIPTGVLPWHKPEHKDGCIAWSIPNIWYFADTDGDGKADLREVLFGPLGYEKDTHGMCSSYRLGRDGWVYATHGFNNTSHFRAKDGSTLDLHSGNVFRFRPDGSRIEIWSWGQVNPFGLAFDRRGNLYSADCHSAPVYQLLQGAHYPSFGKPDDGIGFGPVMCAHNHGSTGICGIAYIDGGVWGPEWEDHLLIGNPVTSRVNHDLVTFAGTTPKANERPDFVVSEDPWFRPVDLQLGPDGALYIADFYNRIIGHYEVPLEHPGRDKERGRIWRVIKKGGAKSAPRPQLSPSGDAVAALKDASPFTQREGAASLREKPQLAALSPLLDLLGGIPADDLQLRHVTRMALRETLKLEGAFPALATWMAEKKPAPALANDLASVVRAVPTAEAAAAVLAALESSGIPDQAQLTHVSRYGDPSLLPRAIALVKKQRPQPAAQVDALEALRDGLAERGAPVSRELIAWGQDIAAQLLATQGKTAEPDWITTPAPIADPARNPNPWTRQVRKCADGEEVSVISSLNTKEPSSEPRTGLAQSRPFPAPEKLSFWICGHRGFPGNPPHDKNFVRLVEVASGEMLRQAFPPRNDVCQRVDWDLAGLAGKQVRFEIVDGDTGGAYAWLGVTRFEPAVISVASFQQDDVNEMALRRLAGFLQSTAPVALREKLAPWLPKPPTLPSLTVSPEDRAKLDALISARVASYKAAPAKGERGAQVFATHCAVCHQIDGQGGLVGPQLDGIGNRGPERLAEDILDPNRNVDAHFYLHMLTRKDGTVTAGFLRGEMGKVVLVADAAGQEHRVPKNEIAEDKATALSVMPPIFGQSIPEADFQELLAYLLKHSINP